MLNVIAKAEQTVAAGQNIVFTNTRVKSRRCGCSSGWLNHIEGSGIFTITNRTNLPIAVELQFNGNVTAAAAGATVLTLKLNGGGWRNRDGLYRSYCEHLSECERGHANPCTGRNKPYCISRKYFYNRSPGKRREPHHQKSCVGGDES